MKIGIYGGSFNPIHCGHINLARELLKQTDIEQIWFLITPQNPFKTNATDLLDDDLRLQIAQKALENDARLIASDFEFHLPKPSYTWDTLQALSRAYTQHEFILIIGADNWNAFDRWYKHEEILNHYKVIVYPRPNYPIAVNDDPRVTIAKTNLYPISSTDIRQRVKEKKSLLGLVPKKIIRLVKNSYKN